MKRGVALTTAAAAIVLGVALYGIGGPDGNGEAQACMAGVETAKVVNSLVGGEIAAFQLTRKPVDLSQIAYINRLARCTGRCRSRNRAWRCSLRDRRPRWQR